MKQRIRKVIILLFCLYSAFFFIGSTLAPIMAYMKHYDFSSLLTSLYMYSCHQQPDRSFWILSYPMALCCRCFGFYLGVFIFGFVDIFDKLRINLKVFITLLTISAIDIVINYGLQERHNTGNVTRFIVGIIMGLLFVSAISYLFRRNWRIKNYED